MLILTGPQGSGNHLFAKLFSMHPTVDGWPMVRTEWKGHHEEQFAKYWDNPSLLKDKKWNEERKYMTSISCPYVKDGKNLIPKYNEFITEAKKYCEVIIGVIGRDRNILQTQQQRLRGGHTTQEAIETFRGLSGLARTYYVSQELFFLYGADYIKSLGEQMNFPVICPTEVYRDYLKNDSNKNYIQQAEGKFDKEVKEAIKQS